MLGTNSFLDHVSGGDDSFVRWALRRALPDWIAAGARSESETAGM
jgi:hypothetical protein